MKSVHVANGHALELLVRMGEFYMGSPYKTLIEPGIVFYSKAKKVSNP